MHEGLRHPPTGAIVSDTAAPGKSGFNYFLTDEEWGRSENNLPPTAGWRRGRACIHVGVPWPLPVEPALSKSGIARSASSCTIPSPGLIITAPDTARMRKDFHTSSRPGGRPACRRQPRLTGVHTVCQLDDLTVKRPLFDRERSQAIHEALPLCLPGPI